MNLAALMTAPRQATQYCRHCGDHAVVKYGMVHLCGDCFLDRSEALLGRFRGLRATREKGYSQIGSQ